MSNIANIQVQNYAGATSAAATNLLGLLLGLLLIRLPGARGHACLTA